MGCLTRGQTWANDPLCVDYARTQKGREVSSARCVRTASTRNGGRKEIIVQLQCKCYGKISNKKALMSSTSAGHVECPMPDKPSRALSGSSATPV